MGLLWSLASSIHFLLLSSLLSSMLTNCLPSVHHPTTHQCHEDESYALLQFKESFVVSEYASYNPSSYPRTASWMRTTDCCSWDGIDCDEITGHVIGIDLSSSQLYGSMDVDSSLFSLVHLQRLDLSDNDFNHSQIPARIGELSQLIYLNLSQFSETTFSGEIPPEVSHFPNLLSLDLRSCIGCTSSNVINQLRLNISTLKSLIQNSTSLEILLLNYVDISSSVPDMLTNLTYLEKLSLPFCGIYGEFPVGIFHLPNLKVLNLGSNYNLRGMLPDFHSSAPINKLDLQGTSFYGTLPASIGNLTSLKWFTIYNCHFYGSIPSSLGNLNQLAQLNIGENQFTIDTIPLYFANLTQLTYFSLTNCNLGGEIPSWMMNLTNLSHLYLDINNLHGEIPHSLFRLVNLETLMLSYNSLQGKLELEMFLKLKMLTSLDLSNNKLSLLSRKSSPNVTISPAIKWLGLDSCNLSGEIPSWIMNLTSTLVFLSLRANKLQGKVPPSLFRLENLSYLTLDYNLLEGELELDMFWTFKMLNVLGLSHNKLSLLSKDGFSNVTLPPLELLELGSCNLVEFPVSFRDLNELESLDVSNNDLKSIPSWMWRKRSLEYLYVSSNSLAGKISPLICNLKSLVVLDFSYNSLSGMIPSCLGSFSQSLESLKLRGNKLVGHIPNTYLIGSVLQMIDFSDNNLQGQLPRAMVNCRKLEFLNLRHNHINDSFPFWLGTLPELKVIALSYNEFFGAIICPNRCAFPKLHIIDLSHNKFFGYLSHETIKNWKSMIASNTSQLKYEDNTISFHTKSWSTIWDTYDRYSFSMSNKGVILDYNEIQQFSNLIMIDLSSNKIFGEIPVVMGNLKGLILLNLSNNMFAGSIPSSLGKLSNLEALDLSFNNLSGKIPQQLTELTFLEFFNVSFNNLSGHIPENQQFSTFQGNSFEGNQGLCGIQLAKKCEDHSRPLLPTSNGDQDSDSQGCFFEFGWKIILIGYAGGLVAGLALGNAFSSDIIRLMKRIL